MNSDNAHLIGSLRDLRDKLQLHQKEMDNRNLPTWHISGAISQIDEAIEEMEEESNG